MDPVLYVWSNSKSEGEEDKVIMGSTYNYHATEVIGDCLLNCTLPCDNRDGPGEFQMMTNAYVADITREKQDISTINCTGIFGSHMMRNLY